MSQLLLVQLGGMALSEALSEQPQLTQQLALIAFGVGTQVGVILPYSRIQESEADRLGLIFYGNGRLRSSGSGRILATHGKTGGAFSS
jgi:Zn-dependent protease with chaperone function